MSLMLTQYISHLFQDILAGLPVFAECSDGVCTKVVAKDVCVCVCVCVCLFYVLYYSPPEGLEHGL